ncbi:hypothetical protein [Glycomyces harbinensis]|uniref:Uncharacterized protein n=1 Tax=Glycomyces harbinensis TaxID=58114 RepID=A0A1G6TR00_9ACTN|nr:hypothetical protein [Glycomyces harbinensis]SDD31543.1 hypothetical protein SAMN05216270_103106 [Glycomyces harbinensis]
MTRLPGADWWIELGLLPLAFASVGAALWHSAFAAEPGGDYGTLAIVLGAVWGVVFLALDRRRFRHRAAPLLLAAPALAVVIAWFAVADVAMDSRGVVEECPATPVSTYEVDRARGGSHWETEYSLDCDRGEARVALVVSGPAPAEESGDDESRVHLVEVEYDPRGLIDPNTDDYVTGSRQNPAVSLWFAGIAAAAGIGLRLAAARSRADRH